MFTENFEKRAEKIKEELNKIDVFPYAPDYGNFKLGGVIITNIEQLPQQPQKNEMVIMRKECGLNITFRWNGDTWCVQSLSLCLNLA